jgi:hypothetical protein
MPQDEHMASRPASLSAVGGFLTARSWRLPLLILLGTFVVFALTARHGGGSWDYYTANYASWHLVHTGHPWIDGTTVPGLAGDPEASTWIVVADNGHTVIRRFPGVIAISLPAYWLANSDSMTVVPGALTAAFACALGIMMMFLALRTRVPVSRAVAACAALAFATPLWTVAADATWPHTVTVLGIGGMAWAAATQRWWLLGIFGGITLWGRLHAAIIVAVVGLLLSWWRRSPRIALVVGIVSALFMGLVCLWTLWWNGSWNPLASYGSDVLGKSQTGSSHLTSELALFIAPDRGILIWTPALLLLIPALIRGWRDVPDWARALLFGGLSYTLVQAWIAPAIGGDSFYGYRHGIELMAAATPALAITVTHLGRTARKLLVPVLALQFCAMAFGATVDVFLLKTDAWHDNAFWWSLRASWPVGPAALLAIICFVVVGMRIYSRNTPQDEPTPAEEKLTAAAP